MFSGFLESCHMQKATFSCIFFVCYILFLVLACSKCKFFWLWNAPLVGNCSRIVLNLQFKVLHKKAGGQWRKGGDWKKVLLSWPKLQVQREFCLLLSAYSGQLRVCCSCLPASHRHLQWQYLNLHFSRHSQTVRKVSNPFACWPTA